MMGRVGDQQLKGWCPRIRDSSGAPESLRDLVDCEKTGAEMRRPQRIGTSTPKAMARLRAINGMAKRTGEPRNASVDSGKIQEMVPSTKQGEKS